MGFLPDPGDVLSPAATWAVPVRKPTEGLMIQGHALRASPDLGHPSRARARSVVCGASGGSRSSHLLCDECQGHKAEGKACLRRSWGGGRLWSGDVEKACLQ